MRLALLTTVAAAALSLGASAATAQGSSGNAPGQTQTRPGDSPSAPSRSEAAPGQSRREQSAPARPEAAPGQARGESAGAPDQRRDRDTASSGSSGERQTGPGEQRAGSSGQSGAGRAASGSDQPATRRSGAEQASPQPSGAGAPAQPGTASSRQQGSSGQQGTASSSQQGTTQQGTASSRQQGTAQQGSAPSSQQGTASTEPGRAASPQQGTASSAQPGAGASGTAASGGAQTDQATGQAARQTGETTTTGSISAAANVNPEQRTRITETLVQRSQPVTNVNFSISVGTTVTDEVRLVEVPDEIVRIVPQYRGYRYLVVRDEIVIVEPRTKRIVEVIKRSGGTRASAAINLSAEKKRLFKTTVQRSAPRTTTTRVTVREGVTLPDEVELLEVPETIVTEVPELRTFRYAVIGEEIAVVEPGTRRIIEIIE